MEARPARATSSASSSVKPPKRARTALAACLLAAAALAALGPPASEGLQKRIAPPGLGPEQRQGRARKPGNEAPPPADPMEPCYLANNRASETLTISESTPVGTVVGELMVSRLPAGCRECGPFPARSPHFKSSNWTLH